ncbi:hypothetical protein HYPSUDRAFT_129120 [Hypholoma sublateritium FD-334 SS-4]|uniref:G-protein coupled receptors family 1 profile domain-containing protein n=1 Tax=Hypholoma sublateritium (strain FD-334 SS-4) TaxID=945553 RepID=A0A0D2MWI0_HYPSF|nr:hypothetical protein HYPSUDRAFT_129120 [Hypholoma sublateritium FD-334 SS-4]
MSNAWRPDEPAYDIFLERTFLAGDFISGLGYGVQIVLYASCAIFLWKTRRSRGRQSLFLLLYTTILLSIETIFSAVQARTVQVIYIDNRNYPGGPWAYFLATQNLPINVMFYATLFILTFLSDLLILWRCWIIWGGSGTRISYAVVSFPLILVIASFAMGTLWTLQSSQPGLSLYSALPMAYGTSYYVISLSVNILLTVLITVRLVMYRRKISKILPSIHGNHYLSLAAIFVESAALYSIIALAFIISYAVNNPINQIFLSMASSAQQIAGYLIVYRLAEGRAWNKSTFEFEGTLLPTLQFHHSKSAGTAMSESNLETPVDRTTYFLPHARAHQTHTV